MQSAIDHAYLKFYVACLVWTCNLLLYDTIHTTTFKIDTILEHTGWTYNAWTDSHCVLDIKQRKTIPGLL